MNEIQFAYWLQGYFELSDDKALDKHQVQIIKDHLKLVFEKTTPEREPKADPIKPKSMRVPHAGTRFC